MCSFFFFFFFQAEDGIRDWSVTGVQTCALPILQRFRDLKSYSVKSGKICHLPFAICYLLFLGVRPICSAREPRSEWRSFLTAPVFSGAFPSIRRRTYLQANAQSNDPNLQPVQRASINPVAQCNRVTLQPC